MAARDPSDAPPGAARTPGVGAPARGRRTAWVRALLGVAVLALAAWPFGCARSRSDVTGVLLLILDTTRVDHCGFGGHSRPTTPEMDRIAAESVVYENAWSPAPWTLPAHAALFTGRLPWSAGFGDGRTLELAKDRPTLAELLRADGWRTGCFTCNGWIGPHTGATRGFEHVDTFASLAVGGTARIAHPKALEWMTARRKAGERFFAFINDVEPHAPWNPPPEQRARFVPPGMDPELLERVSQNWLAAPPREGGRPDPADPDVRKAASALYAGEIAVLDAEVGKLFRGMEESGLLEDTVVIIAGDHGEGLGDHLWLEHGIFLYREILHVPMLIRMPGGRDARRVEDLVRLEDLMPTILELCGAGVPPAIEARSLLGPTEGRVAVAQERAIFAVMPNAREALGRGREREFDAVRRSICDGRWHLIVDDTGGTLLFDLRTDPAELRNVASQNPREVERLRLLLPPLPPGPGRAPSPPGGRAEGR